MKAKPDQAGKKPRKTRERIVAVSTALFNEQGERAVTTNHIAAHLDISPGNLYYHFRNKEEIVFEIYLRFETALLECLELPRQRGLSTEDIARYLSGLFEVLWRYRFLARELPALVERVPGLRARHVDVIERVLTQARAIYGGLVKAGIMQADARQLEALAVNSWLVTMYWLTFQELRVRPAAIIEEDVRQGLRQLVFLFYPYLSGEGKRFVDALVV